MFSSIDHGWRYAYANQPRIAQWNLARLAETLLPLLADDWLALLETFGVDFTLGWRRLADAATGNAAPLRVSLDDFEVLRSAAGRSVRFAVAGRDPGHPNGLDKAGHAEGALSLRWARNPRLPGLRCRGAPIDSLGDTCAGLTGPASARAEAAP